MHRTIEMYKDIINLSRPKSKIKNPMSLEERAAQFSPFAALTGHNEVIKEKARLTQEKIELDDMEKELLTLKLKIIESRLKENIECQFCYFVNDQKKQGGKYLSISGVVKQIDMISKIIILTDKTRIPMDDVIAIDSMMFNTIDNF